MPEPLAPAYRSRLVAFLYDLLNRVLWLPSGSDALRRQLVGALAVVPGSRVLELGCGTGLVTRHLCAAGAEVTAVDRSPAMIRRARRRAPAAAFVVGDVLDGEGDAGGVYERVVLGFMLHELDGARRRAVLAWAAGRLGPGGRVGILEWSLPATRLGARLWRSVIRVIEPPVALEVLDGGLDADLDASLLRVVDERRPAAGRARIVIASPGGP